MRGLKKSKRVSWVSGVNLCQVRLFLSDESPSQVGLGTQDELQAKSSWVSHPTVVGYDDNLPPGFEGSHPTDLLKNKLSNIPLSKWIYPPKFVLDSTWQVVDGEESKEVEVQNQREMRILEAVYPRPSAIPPNPNVLMNSEPSLNSVRNVPLIPITPIEEEDTIVEEIPTHSTAQNPTPVISQTAHYTNSNGITPIADPEMMAQAAYAVLNAVASSNNQASMVDPELLMKILNDPKWHEKLIANHGASTNPHPMPNHSLPSVQAQGMDIGAPSSIPTNLNESFYPSNKVGTSSPSPMPKDLSYYKSLIQQHGEERSDVDAHNQETMNNNHNKAIDLKPKKMKPCVYFNSPRGCRKGATCPYQHDASSSMQGSKRMKLDREIAGEQ